MAKNVLYIAVRHGSNGANQSMCQRAVLTFVEAANRADAEALVQRTETFYNNQHLELILASKASKADYLEAQQTAGACHGFEILSADNVDEIEKILRCY